MGLFLLLVAGAVAAFLLYVLDAEMESGGYTPSRSVGSNEPDERIVYRGGVACRVREVNGRKQVNATGEWIWDDLNRPY